MNICIKSTSVSRNECTEIKAKALHDRHDVLSFKIGHAPFWWITRDPLYDEPTPVRRDIKGFTAHGTGGVRAGTTRLPAIQTTGVKLMTTCEFTGCALTTHARQADGTGGPSMLPAAFLTFTKLLATWGS